MRLEELLSPTWETLETYWIDNQRYYLGCQVCGMLHISNISAAMGKSGNRKISTQNFTLQMIREINPKRGVYLFTYEGIREIIRTYNNETCKGLRARLDS